MKTKGKLSKLLYGTPQTELVTPEGVRMPAEVTGTDDGLVYEKNGENNGNTGGGVNSEGSGIIGEQEIRDRIASDEFPKTIRTGQQNKHIEGTHEYDQYVQAFAERGQYGPSRLTISEDEALKLVKQYAGTGIIRTKKGIWDNNEIITTNNKVIGVVVNNLTGKEMPTTIFKIHYSKDGIHIVPDYPSKKG